MKNIKIKLTEIYLPFLLVAIGSFAFYNLFRWIFDIKLGMLPLKRELLKFWIPFILPWIPIVIWLRRRVRFLKIRGKRDNGYFLYQFIISLAIAIPILLSQDYLEKASFDLIEIKGADEIHNFRREKYFKIENFDIDRNFNSSYVTSRTSGKHNEHLNFQLYIACPFSNNDNVWYGVDYEWGMSNRSNDFEKNKAYRSFIERSEQDFNTYNFQNVNYFEKLTYSDERDGYYEAIMDRLPEINKNNQIILVPKNKDFEQRLGNTLPLIFRSFGIGTIIVFFMVIIPKIDQKELNDFKNNKPLKDDDLLVLLQLFNFKGPFKATTILLSLNIIVFVALTIYGLNITSPTPKELLEVGGNRRLEVLNGEYWRLFTSIFIHSGLMHIISNLVALFFGAMLLEGTLGKIKFLTSFLVCGVLASLSSIYYNEHTVSVGASGAIFGLYGLMLAFTVFKIYPKNMRSMSWTLLGIFGGLNLLLGFIGGIDNAAHFGGLISGFILGILFILMGREKLSASFF